MEHRSEEMYRDENIYEIDGPPNAYFIYVGVCSRIIRYKTIAFKSKSLDKVVEEYHKTLSEIKRSLSDLVSEGIIVWRKRPEIKYDDDTGFHMFYCRVETIPKIPDSKWDGFIIHYEGKTIREI